ncbi:MAG: molecular chaperone [Rivularia sp. (in: cyanobacteria)]
MLEKIALNIAQQVLPIILPKLRDYLVDYLAEKFSPYRQIDNEKIIEDEEEIADEITKDESIINQIKNLVEQISVHLEYDQEEFNKVLGEIKIWSKKILNFLFSSYKEILSNENIDTSVEELDNKLKIRTRLEQIDVNEKFNQIVDERRRTLEELELQPKPNPVDETPGEVVTPEPSNAPKTSDTATTEVESEHQSQQPSQKDGTLRGNPHPGWLAIDFGTSNSTVTVFDQKEVRDPNQELPKQQQERLSELFKDWLGSQPPEAPDGVSNNDNWEKYLAELNRNLNLAGEGGVKQILDSESSSKLLELTRQIELCLGNQQESLRKPVSKKLNDIYHEVFQVPPLEDESLILIELDPNTPGEYQIISELQITNLDNDRLGVKMGSLVSQERLKAISNAEDDNAFKQIDGQFHPSPKRYFIAQDPEHIKVYLEDKHQEVSVEQLIKAAWYHLIELTETYKNNKPERFTRGRFERAIVTYPTVAPPALRSQIEKLVSGLDFTDVKTYYDEAIAAAIFYLWLEFSGNKTIGLEAFKTRSRRSGEKWAQNVLVLDIGGGTTDLALIRLVLKEEDPFNPGEDRGAGGRYYVLTPELMGSSGHLRLGGELITLRVFRLLKVAIADRILSAVAEEKLKDSGLEKILNSVDQSFRSEDKFKSGALLEYVNKENAESNPRYKLALDTANYVLPTRWKEHPKDLQAFYTLWEEAEKAKRILGEGKNFQLNTERVKQLLSYNKNIKIEDEPNNSQDLKQQSENLDLSIELTKDQFEQVASQDIKEAISIAKGLLESRLPVDESKQEKPQQPLDWLILSGQTCKLNLVRDKLKEVFGSSKIHLDRTRITFVDEYAKLATSVGACYAERLQQYRYDPVGAKRKLKSGYSEVELKIKNLLNTLPCTFVRKNQDDSKYDDHIFDPGQSLYQFHGENIAKARSKWLDLQPTNTINRKDYEGAKETPWVNFVFEKMAKELGEYSSTSSDYLKPFKVQFEVNQKLEIILLLCKGKPHYLIDDKCPSLNVGEKILENLKNPEESKQNPQTITSSEQIELQNEPEQYSEKIISNDGKLVCDIVIDVQEGAARTIFKAGESFDQSFRYSQNSEEKPRKGLLSESLEGFPVNGKYTVYADYSKKANQQGEQIQTGKLETPNGEPNEAKQQPKRIYIGELEPPNNEPKENIPYYLTLDDRGLLRIHEGEYFYWNKSRNRENLKQEGYVVEIQPDMIRERKDEERDPFSGIH